MTPAYVEPPDSLPGSVVLTLVNLTLHPVTVYAGDTAVASWPPAGPFARILEVTRDAGALPTDKGDAPLVDVSYGPHVADLPAPKKGTAYIVSRVLAAAVDRADILFPMREVRDEAGRIVGCRALGRFVAHPAPRDAGACDA